MCTVAVFSILTNTWPIRLPETTRVIGPGRWNEPFQQVLCLATCLGGGGFGMIMLLRPEWWVRKFVARDAVGWEPHKRILECAIRLLSVLLIAPAAYFALKCLAPF